MQHSSRTIVDLKGFEKKQSEIVVRTRYQSGAIQILLSQHKQNWSEPVSLGLSRETGRLGPNSMGPNVTVEETTQAGKEHVRRQADIVRYH